MKSLATAIILALVGFSGVLGGCTPDSGQSELSSCDLKSIACQNSCYKAGAGSACTSCCNEAHAACSSDSGSYSFYGCPGKE